MELNIFDDANKTSKFCTAQIMYFLSMVFKGICQQHIADCDYVERRLTETMALILLISSSLTCK